MKVVMQGGPFHGEELDVDPSTHFIKFPQAHVTPFNLTDEVKHHSWDNDALTIITVEYQRTQTVLADAVVFVPVLQVNQQWPTVTLRNT